ncbi:M55 family metallopeptidase [Sulfitobacter mediterraneus]|uniref:M55 family metallopeptidase n=1 Tax=Sulfitobacter mediterraneus TaxID=83219 RepID=UPI001EEDEBAE|nr:M55 family metallopeptidase [Sulfitobacter mediterraneus]
MKVFISVDIEGIAGIAHWSEALRENPDYPAFRDLMTNEAIAACEGARSGGATEIYLRDAHETARNLDIARIPAGVRLIRGWSGHPYKMVQELDDSFDAVVMIGWHGAAGDGGNPLSHTMTGHYAHITLNDVPLSEFRLHALLAAAHNVPVVFLSGDENICAEAQELNPAIATLSTKLGKGASVISMTPIEACTRITEEVAEVLSGDLSVHTCPAEAEYSVSLRFSHHEKAYRSSFFPGATLVADDTIEYQARTPLEVARFLLFM